MPVLENIGYCPICMNEARFVADQDGLRDHYICEQCKSIPRQRALVEVLNIFRPNWRSLTIHESLPSMRFFLEQCNDYSHSFFYEDVPTGSCKDGMRCENLEALTFSNASFDIFITQDVLEHVFHPDKVLAEITRVLRPGGIHIFTAPKHKHLLKSYRRARVVNGAVEHLHESIYHGNPIGDGRSLVTWDYGADFDDLIQQWSGCSTCNFIIRDRDRGIDGEYLDVFVTLKEPANGLAPTSPFVVRTPNLNQASALSDTREEIIRLHQETGRLKHQLIIQEKALIDLTDRLMQLEKETAGTRERQSEALLGSFEECWNARSWRLFSPIRNVFRRLQGTIREEKPAIYSSAEAERWIRAIRESTSWELLGPLRALNRIRQRLSNKPSTPSPKTSDDEETMQSGRPETTWDKRDSPQIASSQRSVGVETSHLSDSRPPNSEANLPTKL
jgi:SAM-dependent methyltransferase